MDQNHHDQLLGKILSMAPDAVPAAVELLNELPVSDTSKQAVENILELLARGFAKANYDLSDIRSVQNEKRRNGALAYFTARGSTQAFRLLQDTAPQARGNYFVYIFHSTASRRLRKMAYREILGLPPEDRAPPSAV